MSSSGRPCSPRDSAIDIRHLPESFETDGRVQPQEIEAEERTGSPLAMAEHAALRTAVRNHRGSRRELAKALGLSERTLYRKLRDLELARQLDQG